jgi:hypothetical protein
VQCKEKIMDKKLKAKWYAAAAGLIALLAVNPLGALPLFELVSNPNDSPTPIYEYYNAAEGHYFVTGAPEEIALLDSVNTAAWVRRADAPAFMAFDGPARALHVPGDQAYARPVCRYFIPPASHFLSASIDECNEVGAKYPEFVFETETAFYAWLPNQATGACPAMVAKIGGFEFQPVYRLWNGRADTNHRLTTSKSERAAMIEQGWISEGYGPEGVAMCAPHWSN